MNITQNDVDGFKKVKYCELSSVWKKIYESEWKSLCQKSKAIAAVIVDENY